MSVRRLADETLQPMAFAFSNDNASWAERKIAEYPAGRQASAVIPLLMRAQDQEGWISRPAIEASTPTSKPPRSQCLTKSRRVCRSSR